MRVSARLLPFPKFGAGERSLGGEKFLLPKAAWPLIYSAASLFGSQQPVISAGTATATKTSRRAGAPRSPPI